MSGHNAARIEGKIEGWLQATEHIEGLTAKLAEAESLVRRLRDAFQEQLDEEPDYGDELVAILGIAEKALAEADAYLEGK